MDKKQVILILFISFLVLSIMHIFRVKAIPYDSWNNYKILSFPDGFEGLQVNFNITYGHGDNGLSFNCQEDFEDLRFFNYEDDELLYAYNETTVNKDYCEIWLKLGSSKNVTMRYNNPNAESYWSLENTFEDIIGGVVLALPMDEGSGSVVYDYSGNGNDGVNIGSSVVSGKFGNGRYFNSSESDYLNCGSDDSLSVDEFDVVTLTAWVNYPSLFPSLLSPIIDCSASSPLRNGYYMTNYNNRILGACWNNGVQKHQYGQTLDSDDLDSWHFEVFVADGQNTTVYLDNVVGGHTDWTSYEIGVNGVDLYIGRFMAIYLNASLDNVGVFSSALSVNQLSNLYNFYGDYTIVEGSVCCRVWGESTIIFGIEFSNSVNDTMLIGILALVVAMCALLLIITENKKK